MINEARDIARKLRNLYGYSPTANMAAAKCLERLASGLEQIKRELDAAIADMKEADRIGCEHCRWYGLCQPAEGEDIDCERCAIACKCKECRNSDQWEWRGMKSGA